MGNANKNAAPSNKGPQKTELAKATGTGIALDEVGERPSYLANVEGGGRRGQENVGRDDITIPRLEIAQDLSPAAKKRDPKFIEGCEPGMFYNNVTRELYGTSVLMIPVAYLKEWLLWKDRQKGGGFGGAYLTEQEAREAIKELDDADDWEAVDTGQQFCLICIQDDKTGQVSDIQQIVVSMAKSKAKTSRKWNSLIRLGNADSFAKIYRLDAFQDKNKQNQDFWNFDVKPFGWTPEQLYAKAEEFYKQLGGGKAMSSRVNRDQDEVSEDAETTAARREI